MQAGSKYRREVQSSYLTAVCVDKMKADFRSFVMAAMNGLTLNVQKACSG